jgi:hypothetical protein
MIAVRRMFWAFELHSGREGIFKLSSDSAFIEKVCDVLRGGLPCSARVAQDAIQVS